MPTAEQLKILIESYSSGDDTRFYRTALQLAADEARRGRGKLAQELRQLVDAARARGVVVPGGKRPIPIAQPRGELGDLLTATYPDCKLEDMVLTQDLRRRLGRVLKENRGAELLKESRLAPRRKLLLVGPPGTGKTMSARVLAGEAEGLSYADIVRACEDAAKEMVLDGGEFLSERQILAAIEDRKSAHGAVKAPNSRDPQDAAP